MGFFGGTKQLGYDPSFSWLYICLARATSFFLANEKDRERASRAEERFMLEVASRKRLLSDLQTSSTSPMRESFNDVLRISSYAIVFGRLQLAFSDRFVFC